MVGYVRVSEETENPENQKFSILMWANKMGHQIIEFFEDVGVSGALPPLERPGFQKAVKALEGADGLVVYALDRIARSLAELVNTVKTIEARGKLVLSVREEWIQSVDPKIRELILAVLGWAGEMEREFIRARTREALLRLKAQGKHVGRPRKISEVTIREAIKYVERGYRLKDVARILGVGYSTLARYLTRQPYRALYYEAKARAARARGA